MKEKLKNLFSFHWSEYRGILFLGLIMMCIYTLDKVLPSIIPEKEYDNEKIRRDIAEFLSYISEKDSLEKSKKYIPFQTSENKAPNLDSLSPPLRLQNFDPNKINESEWLEMGLPPKIIQTMINYRNKGGIFRDKEDILRVYGIEDELYKKIAPYISIDGTKVPDEKVYQPENNSYVESSEPGDADTLLIDLNSADSAGLVMLRGIGPYYALKILRFREKLGGFYSKEQLLEIKGIDSARFEMFENQIIIDTVQLIKIDLNSVSFKDLLKHPYFEYAQVKAIFDYRYKNKCFRSKEELQKVPLIYDSLYKKISPYIIIKNPE